MSEHHMSENRYFGRYLRRIREDRKLSLDAVEEMTVGYPEPVTKSHLSRIENGRAVPTFPRMFALCQVYGVPISSMAERFETDLRRGAPLEQAFDSDDSSAFCARIKTLRLEGEYGMVLQLTSHAIDDLQGLSDESSIELRHRLSIWRIGAMIKLEHYESCKLHCEELISEIPSSSEYHLRALIAFVTCAYRLGRSTVAIMGLDQVQRMIDSREWRADLRAIAHSTSGSVHYSRKDLEGAKLGFERAYVCYEEAGNDFERCRARINLSQVLIDRGQLHTAERYLSSVLPETIEKRFTRLAALAHGHYAMLCFLTERHDNAERFALKSNGFARQIGHRVTVFRNCYYLWKIAKLRGDRTSIASNERNLRTLVERVPRDLPEAELFRQERGDR